MNNSWETIFFHLFVNVMLTKTKEAASHLYLAHLCSYVRVTCSEEGVGDLMTLT